jgi:hypothetical protein
MFTISTSVLFTPTNGHDGTSVKLNTTVVETKMDCSEAMGVLVKTMRMAIDAVRMTVEAKRVLL